MQTRRDPANSEVHIESLSKAPSAHVPYINMRPRNGTEDSTSFVISRRGAPTYLNVPHAHSHKNTDQKYSPCSAMPAVSNSRPKLAQYDAHSFYHTKSLPCRSCKYASDLSTSATTVSPLSELSSSTDGSSPNTPDNDDTEHSFMVVPHHSSPRLRKASYFPSKQLNSFPGRHDKHLRVVDAHELPVGTIMDLKKDIHNQAMSECTLNSNKGIPEIRPLGQRTSLTASASNRRAVESNLMLKAREGKIHCPQSDARSRTSEPVRRIAPIPLRAKVAYSGSSATASTENGERIRHAHFMSSLGSNISQTEFEIGLRQKGNVQFPPQHLGFMTRTVKNENGRRQPNTKPNRNGMLDKSRMINEGQRVSPSPNLQIPSHHKTGNPTPASIAGTILPTFLTCGPRAVENHRFVLRSTDHFYQPASIEHHNLYQRSSSQTDLRAIGRTVVQGAPLPGEVGLSRTSLPQTIHALSRTTRPLRTQAPSYAIPVPSVKPTTSLKRKYSDDFHSDSEALDTVVTPSHIGGPTYQVNRQNFLAQKTTLPSFEAFVRASQPPQVPAVPEEIDWTRRDTIWGPILRRGRIIRDRDMPERVLTFFASGFRPLLVPEGPRDAEIPSKRLAEASHNRLPVVPFGQRIVNKAIGANERIRLPALRCITIDK